MTRKAGIVLACTFPALLSAAVWVPVISSIEYRSGGFVSAGLRERRWAPLWTLGDQLQHSDGLWEEHLRRELDPPTFAFQLFVVLALGALVAFYLHARRPAVVLVGTVLALCAATCWVPVARTTLWQSSGALMWETRERRWTPVWDLAAPAKYQSGAGMSYPRQEVDWPALGLQLAVIVALGGVLTLVLRTRARREALG